MAKNVEIKARIAGQEFEAICRKSKSLATKGPIELRQTDTFFATQRGRLKVREFGDGTAELIFYIRPDATGPKTSDYILSRCDPSVKESLTNAYSVSGIVEKHRTVYLFDQTRIHLDRVTGLGTFLELEVVLGDDDTVAFGEEVAKQILTKLNVAESDLVSGAYVDLLAAENSGL